MRIFFSVFFILLSAQLAFSQPVEYRLAAMPEGASLLGYANLKGEMVIEPQFYQAFGFDPHGVSLGFLKTEVTYHGTASGKKEKVKPFALFDANGNQLEERSSSDLYMLRQNFSFGGEVRAFYGGVFVASSNERYTDRIGVNYKGQIVTKSDYKWMSLFSSGFAVADHRKNGFVIVKPSEEDVKIKGIEVVKAKNPSEGLAPVRDKNGKWGFVNSEGEVVLPAKYRDVGNFWGGYAWARNEEDLIGFINTNGEWVIQPKFSKAKDLDPVSGIAMVVEKRDWCYVNLDGEITYVEKKQKLYPYSEGLAIKRNPSTKKVGCIDASGGWVIEPKFDVIRPFLHGFAVAKQGGLFGLLDKKGEWVIEPKFKMLMDAYPINNL